MAEFLSLNLVGLCHATTKKSKVPCPFHPSSWYSIYLPYSDWVILLDGQFNHIGYI
jgi:hypothetical protein